MDVLVKRTANEAGTIAWNEAFVVENDALMMEEEHRSAVTNTVPIAWNMHHADAWLFSDHILQSICAADALGLHRHVVVVVVEVHPIAAPFFHC